MLGFAQKMTLSPWEMQPQDVAELRRHGLTDDEILALVLLAGFFSLATRIADALGVELDAELGSDCGHSAEAADC